MTCAARLDNTARPGLTKPGLLPDQNATALMKTVKHIIITGLMNLALWGAVAPAGADPGSLLVGICPFTPFIILDDEEQPKGFAVDLWERMARELNLDFTYIHRKNTGGIEADLAESRLNRVLLKFIENGTMDTIREKWLGREP